MYPVFPEHCSKLGIQVKCTCNTCNIDNVLFTTFFIHLALICRSLSNYALIHTWLHNHYIFDCNNGCSIPTLNFPALFVVTALAYPMLNWPTFFLTVFSRILLEHNILLVSLTMKYINHWFKCPWNYNHIKNLV